MYLALPLDHKKYIVFDSYADLNKINNVFLKYPAILNISWFSVCFVASTLQPLRLDHGKDLVHSDETGDWNPWEEDEKLDTISLQQKHKVSVKVQERIAQNRPKVHKVQIWGKAAIGRSITFFFILSLLIVSIFFYQLSVISFVL